MASKKDEILDRALVLIRSYGYHRMSLDDILTASQAGKGQFYHYFRSKEQLGYALVDRAWQAYSTHLTLRLEAAEGDPLTRVFQLLDEFVADYRAGDSPGCLFGALAQELCDQHDGFRERLRAVFRGQIELYTDLFTQAREWGWLPAEEDPRQLARFLVALLEGGLLLSKAEGSPAALETAVGTFKRHVALLCG